MQKWNKNAEESMFTVSQTLSNWIYYIFVLDVDNARAQIFSISFVTHKFLSQLIDTCVRYRWQ